MNEIRKTAAIAGTNDAADKALTAVIGERQVFVHYKRHKAIHLHTCPECLHAAAVIEANRKIEVSLTVSPVFARDVYFPVPTRYRAEIIARETGAVLYRGSVQDSPELARTLARKAIDKRGYQLSEVR